MGTGTASGYDASLASPRIMVKAIVPVDAIVHRLGDGVMTYLANHGVAVQDIISYVFEMCLRSNKVLNKDTFVEFEIHEQFINHVEMLEYNGQNFDLETFNMQFIDAIYSTYVFAFHHIRQCLLQSGISDMRVPFPTGTKLEPLFNSRNKLDSIHVEMLVEDDENYDLRYSN